MKTHQIMNRKIIIVKSNPIKKLNIIQNDYSLKMKYFIESNE